MTSALPSFAIIIPTRDRPSQLAACLASLTRLDYPRDRFEVIVVDDGSRPPIPEVTAKFQDRLNLTLLTQSPAGPAAARNAGAARATGQFLAFTDDDCTPAPDWLRKLTIQFGATPDHLVGGRVINALTGNPYSAASHVILDVIYDYYDPRQGRAHFFPTSNLAIAAGQFYSIGGFSKNWPVFAAEDREFSFRWLKQGGQLTYAPEARVYHHRPLTLRTFWRQHFNYGRGAFHYHLTRTETGPGSRQFDWRFYWACVCRPFRHMPMTRAMAILALLFVWQAANTAGYFIEGRQRRQPRR
jgi:cellulose synthase/poly-beta-1,6-N-acetylglucosamine synthase-like glycosyltransferase